MNKNDPRFITAEKKIFEAVYALFPHKDIESIKTQDIITCAGIHKSTFYSHYRDKYALIDALVDVVVEKLAPHLESITLNMLGRDADEDRLRQSYKSLANSIYDNREMLLAVLQSSMGQSLITKIESELKDIWNKSGIADPESSNIDYLINGAAFIIIGTIDKWLQRDCVDSIDALAWLINATGEGIRYAFALL